jgi:adenine-specific DNA-methyltransferase
MGRGRNGRAPFRFLWNRSQATAHNVYLCLYPKGPLRRAFERRPALHQDVFAALQSLDTDAIKADGRVYGGGLFKLEPNELGAISAEFLLDVLGSRLDRAAEVRQPGLFRGA